MNAVMISGASSGDNVDELLEGLKEAVAIYLSDGENSATALSELKLAVIG